jgi:hypothetical protein
MWLEVLNQEKQDHSIFAFDQEISRGFDFGNWLDWNKYFSIDRGISDFLEFIQLKIGFYK